MTPAQKLLYFACIGLLSDETLIPNLRADFWSDGEAEHWLRRISNGEVELVLEYRGDDIWPVLR
jgi:hypothetical protein